MTETVTVEKEVYEAVLRNSVKVADLEAENTKLKELLKECVHYVVYRCIETRETLTKPYTASDKALHKKAEKLLIKIDEVLK